MEKKITDIIYYHLASDPLAKWRKDDCRRGAFRMVFLFPSNTGFHIQILVKIKGIFVNIFYIFHNLTSDLNFTIKALTK